MSNTLYIWCDRCNSKVRVSGKVWRHRLVGDIWTGKKGRKHPEHPDCYAGWYCDNCANEIEMGIDCEY